MTQQQSLKFLQGKKKTRGELRLPALHFVFTDDWADKVGERALFAWLRFYTWADRSDSKRDADAIPTSLAKVAKKLSISRETLYNQIIRPLWNYGLIDLQEVDINGNICVNIIVYEYPQNDPDNVTKPIEKVRDYDTDYQSEARLKAQKSAKKRQSKNAKKPRAKRDKSTMSKKRTTLPVLKMDSTPVQNEYSPPVLELDSPCTENGHNNVLNPSNASESLSNVSELVSNVSAKDQFPRLTDRLNELQFKEKIQEKLIALTIKEKLTDDQAVTALNMAVASGRADKLHFWNYIGVVYKEKAGIAKASDAISATQQAGQKRAVIEDELPAAIKRQKEREAEEERLKAAGLEIEQTPAKTVMDDPELSKLYKSLEQQRVKSGNPLVSAKTAPISDEDDEKPF